MSFNTLSARLILIDKFLNYYSYSMQTIIIIGASAAGLTVASLLCKLSKFHIICLTKEAAVYNTCLLSGVLAGKKTSENIHLVVPSKAQGTFTMRYGTEVMKIDRETKRLFLKSGEILNYDTVLLATGSQPRLLSHENFYSAPGVFAYHTLQDVDTIKTYIKKEHVSHAVVIGAGINGLECAVALNQLGLKVTIVEKEDQILKHMITSEVANAIESLFALNGIAIIKDAILKQMEIMQDEKRLLFSNEVVLSAQLVITAIGSTPNVALAKDAGLLVGKGVLVNQYMQTSDMHIFAAGDCIEFFNKHTHNNATTTLWHDAIAQAVSAAYAVVGQPKEYLGSTRTIHTNFFGKSLIICGTISNQLHIKRVDHTDGFSLLYIDELGFLEGFVLWCHTESFGSYKKLLLSKEQFGYKAYLKLDDK